MTLIKSISGIRGTIGGIPGEGLSPLDIVKFTSAYGEWVKRGAGGNRVRVVTGRDARTTGEMVMALVNSTLSGMGIDVLTLGLASTPTVEIAVKEENAGGGIIITASHNPGEWNALKLLDSNGEFLDSIQGELILELAEKEAFSFSPAVDIGKIDHVTGYDERHIDLILGLDEIDVDAIREAGFVVAFDSVNSVGGVVLPKLLDKLGVKEIYGINTTPDGLFSHNPEPLPANLGQLSALVREKGADVGFAVDPDVDRLAIVSEDGSFFNEEYTLVACADYVLSRHPGNTVSNISSTRALRDVTVKHGGKWHPSSVGEVNVVAMMKETGAVIGGEGNGGVIYPPLHYGRDALVGIALFLSSLALKMVKCTELRSTYPSYIISKNRIDIDKSIDPDYLLDIIDRDMGDTVTDRNDGILAETEDGWVQARKSNTESIIRIYAEGRTADEAGKLADGIIKIVKKALEDKI